MKTAPLASGCLVIIIIIALFAALEGGLTVSRAASDIQLEPNPEPVAVQQGSAPLALDPFDPKKYEFSNLPEAERALISQKTRAESSSSANQLMYDFRAKQENIRLYEVILLAVMSLCALAIVLKYMKDSKTCNARDMLNGTGLVLVIFSTVLVIIIADVEIQLTAAMGVLGGIAGYLFGTLRSSVPGNSEKKVAEATTENNGDKPEVVSQQPSTR